MTYNKTKKCWRDMKYRCDKSTHKHYSHYGGRGITYQKSWKIFENFLKDMGEKPEGLSLDRIDNDKNYSKNNCRWTTQNQQSRNRSQSIIYRGECAKDASIRLGGSENLVQKRIKYSKWSIKKSFTTLPLNPYEKKT